MSKPKQIAEQILKSDASSREVVQENLDSIDEQGPGMMQDFMQNVIDALVNQEGMNRDDAETAVKSAEGRDMVDGGLEKGMSPQQIAKEMAKDAPDHVFQ